eukprot:s57_g18.t1
MAVTHGQVSVKEEVLTSRSGHKQCGFQLGPPDLYASVFCLLLPRWPSMPPAAASQLSRALASSPTSTPQRPQLKVRSPSS